MTEYQSELNEAMPAASALNIRVPAGDIRIAAGDGDEIQLHAVKHVRAASEAEARSFMAQMRIEQRRDGEEWFIEATWPQPHSHTIRSAHVSFEVRAPGGIRLKARSGHGRIEATGCGDASLSTGSGDLRAHAVSGALSAHTGHGAILISECEGRVEAETSSGDLRITQAQSVVEARTGHGAIQLEACAGPVKAESRSGDVRARDLSAAIEARTGHGRIEVAGVTDARLQSGSGDVVARVVSGTLEARTGHGAIQTEDCSGAVQVESSSGDLRISRTPDRVRAKTGHGRIEVAEVGEAVLHSSSGDIRARGITGSLEAGTGHGAIEIEGCTGAVTVDSRSGDVRIRQAAGSLRAATRHGLIIAALLQSEDAVQVELTGNGGIELTLPEAAGARLEADTGSGRVEMQPEVNPAFNPRRTHLEAVLGDGRGSVRLRTGTGNIRIRLVGGD